MCISGTLTGPVLGIYLLGTIFPSGNAKVRYGLRTGHLSVIHLKELIHTNNLQVKLKFSHDWFTQNVVSNWMILVKCLI